jgi:hypothetical protein
MNMQEIFDTVAVHLFKQGRRAVTSHPLTNQVLCQYLTDNGLKCAVGCLIPRDRYVLLMENMGVRVLLDKFGVILPDWMSDPENISLMAKLQYIHDDRCSWYSPKYLAAKLREAARYDDIDVSILTKLEAEATWGMT